MQGALGVRRSKKGTQTKKFQEFDFRIALLTQKYDRLSGSNLSTTGYTYQR